MNKLKILGIGGDGRHHQDDEDHSQHYGDIEQDLLNSPSCAKYTAGILASQAAQAYALVLQHDGSDQGDRSYNQSDLKISYHNQPPKI